MSADLRQLPAVHQILDELGEWKDRFPHELLVAHTRRAIAAERESRLSGKGGLPGGVAEQARRSLAALAAPSLRRVINATGVVLHTNLGRAPIPEFEVPFGYSNLEYDLAAGRRGKRDTHIAALIEAAVGATGIAVNNNAAAVWLVLNELAAGGEAIVSRGELIEIGDGFRIPDIMAKSGVTLREVGTTNRTRLDDYRAAINEKTRLLMIVHPSNFRIEGFTGKPTREELVQLGRETGIPVYEDLGSGCIADLSRLGLNEPRVADAVRAGVTVLSFSADKLLGGPQAGLIAGDPTLVARIRRNPMFRAFRLDKIILAALESTLRSTVAGDWPSIPALAMIATPAAEVRARAQALLARLPSLPASIAEDYSVIGGGSTPEQRIATFVIRISCDAAKAERHLRAYRPPVIARIESDHLIVDLRTVFPCDEEPLLEALAGIAGP